MADKMADHLAAPQIMDTARSMFDEFDKDDSGELDGKEVQKLCKKMGVKLSKKGLAAAMAEMDEDGSGEVGFDEFNLWWSGNAGTALDRFPAQGSVLIKFTIKPSSKTGRARASAPTPRQLAEKLSAMAQNPNSAVFKSALLSKLNTAKGISVNVRPPIPPPEGSFLIDDLTEFDLRGADRKLWNQVSLITETCKKGWRKYETALAEDSVSLKIEEGKHVVLWDDMARYHAVLIDEEIQLEYLTVQSTIEALRGELAVVENDLKIETVRARMDKSITGAAPSNPNSQSERAHMPTPPAKSQSAAAVAFESPLKLRSRRGTAPGLLRLGKAPGPAPLTYEGKGSDAIRTVAATKKIQSQYRRKRDRRRFVALREKREMVMDMREAAALEAGIELSHLPQKAEIAAAATDIGLDTAEDEELLWLADEFLCAPLPEGWSETFMPDYQAVFYCRQGQSTGVWEHPMTGYYSGVVSSFKSLQTEIVHGFATGATLHEMAEIGSRVDEVMRWHRKALSKMREEEGLRLANSDMQEVDTVLKTDIGNKLIADRVTAKVRVMSRLLGGGNSRALSNAAKLRLTN